MARFKFSLPEIAISVLIIGTLVINARVGEWNHETRVGFNAIHYLSSGLFLLHFAKEKLIVTKLLYIAWAILFFWLTAMEIIDIYIPLSIGNYKYWFLTPLVLAMILERVLK